MDPLLQRNFITTKDAGELSGYTSDYLARLARSGKIEGRLVGHAWFIEKDSLAAFLSAQQDRKIDRARELARARAKEYRSHSTLLYKVRKVLPDVTEEARGDIVTGSFWSPFIASGIAVAVIAFGTVAARADVLPRLAHDVTGIALQATDGFADTFGSIPWQVAARIAGASRAIDENTARVSREIALGTDAVTVPLLASPDLSPVRMALDDRPASRIAYAPLDVVSAQEPVVTVSDLQASATSAARFVMSPASARDALVSGYLSLGDAAYGAIRAAFGGYRSLIERAGNATLSLAIGARDAIAHAPRFVDHANRAIVGAVADLAHAAIRADVSLAYGLAAAAPESARAAVSFVGTAGNALTEAAAAVPRLASSIFETATAFPATAGPALAEGIFNSEYAAARTFVAATNRVTSGYLAVVTETGRTAYVGAVLGRDVTRAAAKVAMIAPTAVENAYLGTLGKGALALANPTRALIALPPVAAAIEATVSGLSVGERAALATYEALHGVVDSTTRFFAYLFVPAKSNVAVAPSAPIPAATTAPTAPARAPADARVVAVNSYPTYTTIVRGVSRDELDQSLEQVRSNLLIAMNALVAPVAAQTATNITTIQMVNRIEALSNLVVRDGSFQGGTFDRGTITNGFSITANEGTFGSIVVGGNGGIGVGGGITAGGSVTGSYFVASSTTATTTFAGSLAIDTNGFVYATSTKNVGIGVLSPAALLAIQNSNGAQPIFTAKNAAGTEVYRITDAGFVGIGTSSPAYALAVEGSSTLGNRAIAGYFTATSTAATSTFAGRLAVGTSSPWGNGILTVGTSSPLLHIDSTTGYVGMGTSSPAQRLAVSGNGYFTGSLGIGVATTTPGVLQTSGNAYIGGNLTVIGNSTVLGASIADSLTINSSIKSSIIPNQNATYNLGSPSYFWHNAYIDTLTANNISAASTTIGGTQSDTFTINSDNATADTEDMHIIFYRGTVVPNALISWNSIRDRFEFNQPTFIQNTSASTTIATLELKGLSGQTADLLRIASSTDSPYFNVTAAGRIGVGTSTPAVAFDIYSTNAIRIPVGTTVQRPATGDVGYVRYNLTTHQFEGYGDNAVWQGLGGVIDANQDTKITADTNNANEDYLRFFTFGSERMSISNTGMIGVGSTTPFARFGITGAAGGTDTLFAISTSTAAFATTTSLAVDANGNLSLNNGASLTVAGNLTVSGTTSFGSTFNPNVGSNVLLSVNGSGAIVGTSSPSVAAVFATSTSATSTFAGGLAVGTSQFVVDRATGRVGVGTVSPSYALDVAGNARFTSLVDATQFVATSTSATSTFAGGLAAGNNAALTVNAAASANALYIAANGRLGVGTSTPAVTFDIYATDAIRLPVGTTAQRPATGDTGYVRYNLTTHQFEGYGDNAVWQGLGGVINAAQTSYITADSSDILHFVTNSVERQTITAAGNVGIASTTPLGLLSINPTGITGPSFVVGSSTATNFIITAAGNVGIGTTSPAYPLSVAGVVYASGGIRFPDGSVQSAAAASGNSALAGQVSYYATNGTTVSGTSTLYIASNSRIGIGTTTPAALLNISGSTADLAEAILQDNRTTSASGPAFNLLKTRNYISANNNDVAGDLNFQFYNTAAARTTAAQIEAITTEVTAAGEKGQLKFSTMNAGTLTEAMRIVDTGRIGVGSTTPWGQLSVNPNGVTGPSFVVGSSTATSFIVTNGGNVGIGTAVPPALLSVRATGLPTANISTVAGLNGKGILIQADDEGVGAKTGIWTRFSSSPGLAAGITMGRYGSSWGTFIAFHTHADNAGTLDSEPEAMRIDGSGNVGIGTTTPNAKLQVVGGSISIGNGTANAGANLGLLGSLGGKNWMVGNQMNVVGFEITPSTANGGSTFTTPAFIINDSGNVGIGTTNPGSKLEVNGDIKITAGSGGRLIFADGTTLSTNSVTGSAGLTSWGDLNFQTGGAINFQTGNGTATSSKMVVTNAGNVGIGTASPANDLDVIKTGQESSIGIQADTAQQASLYFGTGAAGQGALYMPANTDDLRMWISGTGDVATFKSGGNVGIGTTTPESLLNVYGSSPKLSIRDSRADLTGVTTMSGLEFYTQDASYTNKGTIPVSAIRDTNEGDVGAWHSLTFWTGSDGTFTEKMRVTSAGNVGIGSTTPNAPLTVVGNTRVSGITAGTGIFADNGQLAGIFSLTRQDTVATADLSIAAFGGIGFTGGSTSYNNAVASNYAMYVSSSGRVGVGTTSPFMKLSVVGDGTNAAVFDTGGVTIRRSAISFLDLADTGASGRNWRLSSDSNSFNGSFAIADNTAGQTRLVINSSGNVGIGTTTPYSYGAGYTVVDAYGSSGSMFQTTSGSGGAITEIYSPAGPTNVHGEIGTRSNDPLALKTNNTERVRIDTSGNVGIGTTTPVAKLQVVAPSSTGNNGTWSTANLVVSNGTNPGMGFGYNTASGYGYGWIEAASPNIGFGNIAIAPNGGNVGIGTTTPVTRLAVSGAGIYNASGAAALTLYNTVSGKTAEFHIDDAGIIQIADYTNAKTRFQILPGTATGVAITIDGGTGNVGIGQTSPSSKLEVNGDIRITSASGGRLYFADGTSMTTASAAGSGTTSWNDLNFQTGGVFNFQTGNGSATSTKMVVTNAGNVGIGTASPGYLLTVGSGTNSVVTGAKMAVFGNGSVYSTVRDTGNNIEGLFGADSSGVIYGSMTSNSVLFRVGNTEKMIINTSGNVGIGTTTPGAKLDVGGNASVGLAANGNSQLAIVGGPTGLSRLIFDMGTGNNRGFIDYDNALRAMEFKTNETEAMRITSAGNVGIGTTSPIGKLHLETNNSDYLYVDDTLHNTRAVLAATSNGAQLYARDLNNNSAALVFTGASEYARFTSSGNLGIGTTTPGDKLIVNGGALFGNIAGLSYGTQTIGIQASGNIPALFLGGGGVAGQSKGIRVLAGTNSSDYALNIADYNSNPLMYVRGDGNIGIGTTTPRTALDIERGTTGLPPASGNANSGIMRLNIYGENIATDFGALASGASWIQSHDANNWASNFSLLLNPNGGNVGIGTTTPTSARLTVSDTGNTFSGFFQGSGYAVALGGSTVAQIQSYSASLTAGNLALQMAGGNVGIGTASPAYKLDVNGSLNATSVYVNGVLLSPGTGSNWTVSGSDIYRSAGNVTVGGSSANTLGNGGTQTTLEVHKASGTGYLSLTSDLTADASLVGVLNFGTSGASTDKGAASVQVTLSGSAATSASGVMHFYTRNGGTFGERMTILSNGNVGIGTTSPTSALEIARVGYGTAGANITLSGYSNLSGNRAYLTFNSSNSSTIGVYSTTNTNDYLGIIDAVGVDTNNTSQTAARLFIRQDGAAGAGYVPARYEFRTSSDVSGPTAKMVILSGGNVGIGTTSPTSALHVQNTSGTVAMTVDASTQAYIRFMKSSVGKWQVGTDVTDASGNSNLQFYSSTAGGVMTMLQSNGNVGIGTTSPATLLGLQGGIGVSSSQLYLAANAYVGIGTTTPHTYLELSGANVANRGQLTITGSDVAQITLYKDSANQTFSIAQTQSTGNTVFTNSVSGANTVALLTGTGNFIVQGTNGNAVILNGGSPASTLTTNANGYVGIGIASAYRTFEAHEGTNQNFILRPASELIGSATGVGIQAYNDAHTATVPLTLQGSTVSLSASGGNDFYVAASGNVGIGTTTPQGLLHVGNGGDAPTAGSAASRAYFTTNGQTDFLVRDSTSHVEGRMTASSGGIEYGAVTNNSVDFVTNNTTRMFISATGNVGIGTTTPGFRIQTADTNGQSAMFDSTNASGGWVQFARSNTVYGLIGNGPQVISGAPLDSFAIRSNNALAFSTGGATERMRIDSSGNVGIGTTTPRAKLDVYTSGWDGVNIDSSSEPWITFNQRNGTAGSRVGVFGYSSGKFDFSTLHDDYTGQASAAWIDRSGNSYFAGNMGIGTTTPGTKLQITPAANAPAPTLGAISGGLYLSSYAGTYGLMAGVTDTGPSWIQAQRTDGSATAYDLLLQPSGGNVGIGRTPGVKFDVQSVVNYQAARITAGGAGLALGVDGSGNGQVGNTAYGAIITLAPGGSTSIATLGLGYVCSSAGGTLSSGATCATSDQRLKTNITNISSQMDVLAALERLNGVYYNWDLTNPFNQGLPSTRQVGMIAQNVEQVFPELVYYGTDGYARLDYQKLVGFLVEVNKAEQGEIKALDQKTSFIQNAATSTVLTVDASGNVGIGTATPTHTLDVAGDIAAISFVNTSTRTMKTDIEYADATTTETMLAKLMNFKVATYRYTIENQNDPLRLGLIAEDLQTTAPEVLSIGGKGVDIYKLATFTLGGVQALAERVNSHETRLASLESRVAALESGAISSASGSPITFSTSTLASALQGFGVLIEKGIAQFNTLVFRQLVASKDADGTSSAGTVTILAGNTVAQVNNALVAPTTKVFVTFNGQVQGSWWVSDKQAGSFRVILSAAQASDLTFDYFLVQTEGQIATPNGDGTYQGAPSVSQGAPLSGGPDTTAPVITLLGDNPLHVAVGGVFTDPGVTVTDDVDGTDAVTTYVNGVQQDANSSTITTSSATTYIITYRAMDKAGNTTTAQRSVMVGNPDGVVAPTDTGTGATTATSTASADTTAPVVTLIGAAALEIREGQTFADPGATAMDATDGDLTSRIVKTGSVNAATAGLYTITYSATDAAGNTGSASRAVSVLAPVAPAPAATVTAATTATAATTTTP